MRLLSLNIWGGKLFEPLITFLKEESSGIDIFCFQEVFSTLSGRTESHEGRANVFSEIAKSLPDFAGYFQAHHDYHDYSGRVDFHISYGLAIFIRKNFTVTTTGDFFVNANRNVFAPEPDIFSPAPRNLQYLQFQQQNSLFSIVNFHGIWIKNSHKYDTPERLEQSRRVRSIVDLMPERKILCGDFNLLPATRSYGILKEEMVDMIEKYTISSTRSSLYTKNEKMANYMLVSPDIRVHDFTVPNVTVSDHLPLILDFE